MKILKFNTLCILLVLLSLGKTSLTAQNKIIPKPSEAQLRWHGYERMMFIHFGPAAWQGREYDNMSSDIADMKMTQLDTDQWCKAAKLWGAKMILFVAKHTGGYCWWQTETSSYGIKETPWKDGKGDLMKDLSESCLKYGLDMGVYIYPGDDLWGAPIGSGGITNDPSKQEAYNEVFRTQLTEVLTKYGKISEVWFDGNCLIEVGDILEKHASESAIFQGKHANLRWVGNEDGFAPYPNWYTLDKKDLVTGVATSLHSDVEGNAYAPVEVDVPLLKNKGHKWFWRSESDTLVMTQEQLMEVYYKSVGRGSVLLLNASPDTTGLIPQAQLDAFGKFGKELEARFSKPIKSAKDQTKKEIILDLGGNKAVNHLVIEEDLREGQLVLSYTIEGKENGEWKTLYEGSSIGNKKIDVFETVTIDYIRLKINESKSSPRIKSVSVYHIETDLSTKLKASENQVIIDKWTTDSFHADCWTQLEFDLTPYMMEIGEYELVFSRLASDYLTGKSPLLEFENIELTMYGELQDATIQYLPREQTLRITRSQQTLDYFPTNLKMKVKHKGAKSMGEIYIKRITY